MTLSEADVRWRCCAAVLALLGGVGLAACTGDDDAPAASVAPPTILTGPQGASVPEGRSVALTVVASSPGEAPTYQWLLDGVPIGGANGASYTTPPLPFTTGPFSQTFSVRVGNSAGQVLSQAVGVSRSAVRSWRDIDTPLPANVQSQARTALARDAAGRTHIASAQLSGGAGALHLLGYGRDDDQDLWSYSVTVPMLGPGEVDNVVLASSGDGTVMVVWAERYRAPPSGPDAVLRSAVYKPHAANPRLPGAWTVLDGTLQTPGRQAFSAAIASAVSGVYEIAWDEGSDVPGVGDARVRRFTVPLGAPSASGYGPIEPLEEGPGNAFGPFRLVPFEGAMLAMHRTDRGDSPQLTVNHRAAGAAWQASRAVDAGPATAGVWEIEVALNESGVAMVTAADNGGRLSARRINVATGAWVDAAWSSSFDCNFSGASVTAAEAGGFDVFCIVQSPTTWTLKQWPYRTGSGWPGAGTVLVSNDSAGSNFGVILATPRPGRDAAGNLLLTFFDKPALGVGTVRSMRYSARSAAWTTPVAVDPPGASTSLQHQPTVQVDPAGSATLVWEQIEVGAGARMRWARLR